LGLALLAALPSIWRQPFSPLAHLELDTDPQNMPPQDEAVRVFYDRMKRAFSTPAACPLIFINRFGDYVMNMEREVEPMEYRILCPS
jgi:hypothetical protein